MSPVTILFNNSCFKNFTEYNIFSVLPYIPSCSSILFIYLFISPCNPSMSLKLLVQPNPSNPIITQHFNLVALLVSCLLLMTCRFRLTNDVYRCIFFPVIHMENFMPHSTCLQQGSVSQYYYEHCKIVAAAFYYQNKCFSQSGLIIDLDVIPNNRSLKPRFLFQVAIPKFFVSLQQLFFYILCKAYNQFNSGM